MIRYHYGYYDYTMDSCTGKIIQLKSKIDAGSVKSNGEVLMAMGDNGAPRVGNKESMSITYVTNKGVQIAQKHLRASTVIGNNKGFYDDNGSQQKYQP